MVEKSWKVFLPEKTLNLLLAKRSEKSFVTIANKMISKIFALPSKSRLSISLRSLKISFLLRSLL